MSINVGKIIDSVVEIDSLDSVLNSIEVLKGLGKLIGIVSVGGSGVAFCKKIMERLNKNKSLEVSGDTKYIESKTKEKESEYIKKKVEEKDEDREQRQKIESKFKEIISRGDKGNTIYNVDNICKYISHLAEKYNNRFVLHPFLYGILVKNDKIIKFYLTEHETLTNLSTEKKEEMKKNFYIGDGDTKSGSVELNKILRSAMKERDDAGLATPKQLAILYGAGVQGADKMSKKDAIRKVREIIEKSRKLLGYT